MSLAVIEKAERGFNVQFERRMKHSASKVWSMLTENEQLAKWFPELSVDNLWDGGSMKFAMQDGTYKEMEITELREQSVLEYTWGDDLVRFELYPMPEGSHLVLIEKVTTLTSHTPRDLAGWDVCLDVIEALLDGRTIDSRMDIWSIKYEQYQEVLSKLQ